MGFGDGSPVSYADIGDVGPIEEEFSGVLALGLEAPEFGGAFVQDAMGLGSGPVDGFLDFLGARGVDALDAGHRRGLPWFDEALRIGEGLRHLIP